MHRDAFKIAFIGSHGVGKTTLCYGLAARLKAADHGLDLVSEVARRCPLPINHDTTLAAQAWILHTQIAEEIVAESRNSIVICDRSVLDNFVYLLLATGPQPRLETVVSSWIGTYDLMIRVPIVDTPQPDGLRSTDPGFQTAVEDRLDKEIEKRNLPVIRLRPAEREGWLDHVEVQVREILRPAQLELPGGSGQMSAWTGPSQSPSE